MTVLTIYCVGFVVGAVIGLVAGEAMLESFSNRQSSSLDLLFVVFMYVIGGLLWPAAITFAIIVLWERFKKKREHKLAH